MAKPRKEPTTRAERKAHRVARLVLAVQSAAEAWAEAIYAAGLEVRAGRSSSIGRPGASRRTASYRFGSAHHLAKSVFFNGILDSHQARGVEGSGIFVAKIRCLARGLTVAPIPHRGRKGLTLRAINSAEASQ